LTRECLPVPWTQTLPRSVRIPGVAGSLL
jgi:hypothetical protein